MKVTIKISMDNAAFEHNGAELARILKKYAHHIEEFETLNPYDNENVSLMDINGNTVGTVKITK